MSEITEEDLIGAEIKDIAKGHIGGNKVIIVKVGDEHYGLFTNTPNLNISRVEKINDDD
jgi:hypothetical protein